MKKIYLSLLALAITSAGFAQKKDLAYPLAVSFHSMCCGVPSDSPLVKYITVFKKKNRIKKIAYCNIGPQGREGEYTIAFPLKELSKRQSAVFIKGMKPVVENMKDRGNAVLEEHIAASDIGGDSRMKKTKMYF